MTTVLHVSDKFTTGVAAAVREIATMTATTQHVVITARAPARGAHDGDVSGPPPVYDLGPKLACVLREPRDVLRRFKADIVHLHSSWPGLLGRVRTAHCPIVYSPHGLASLRTDVPRPIRRGYELTEVLLASRTSAFLANGRDESNRLNRISRGLAPVEWVTFGTRGPSSCVTPMSGIAESRNPFTVGAIGRVCPQKDPTFFIEVANYVRSRLPAKQRLEFEWIGGVDKGRRGQRLQKLLTHNNIRVTGWKAPDQVAHSVKNFDVLLHTAAWEAGVPIAVLEAARAGVPTVVRRTQTTWDWASAAESEPSCVADKVIEALREPEAARERDSTELIKLRKQSDSADLDQFYRNALTFSRIQGPRHQLLLGVTE